MFKIFFLITAIVFDTFSSVRTLQCHKCNDMVAEGGECKSKSVQDCEKSFPQQQSVCLKTTRKFSLHPNDPMWVFTECQIREIFEPQQIDTCITTDVEGGLLTSCTCTTDLCNGFGNSAASPKIVSVTSAKPANVQHQESSPTGSSNDSAKPKMTTENLTKGSSGKLLISIIASTSKPASAVPFTSTGTQEETKMGTMSTRGPAAVSNNHSTAAAGMTASAGGDGSSTKLVVG